MTNQVNQAFEKWFESQYNHKPKENNGVYMTMFADGASKGYQAATQASESEINSLKQRVEELLADNNRLREALKYTLHSLEGRGIPANVDPANLTTQFYRCKDVLRKALSSTPAQSLAERKEQYEDKLIAQFTDPNL